MAKRWNERSRKALTDLGTGGRCGKGAGGGGGGEELQLPCSVHCVLFFIGDTFLSSRLSLFRSMNG